MSIFVETEEDRDMEKARAILLVIMLGVLGVALMLGCGVKKESDVGALSEEIEKLKEEVSGLTAEINEVRGKIDKAIGEIGEERKEIKKLGEANTTLERRIKILLRKEGNLEKHRPVIGVHWRPLTDETRRALGLKPDQGLIVSSIGFDSARKAGIKVGDIVVSLGGIEVTSNFSMAKEDFLPGDIVSIVLFREGKKKTMKATLGCLKCVNPSSCPLRSPVDRNR